MNWWKSEFEFTIPITILEVLFGIPNEINDKYLNLLNLVYMPNTTSTIQKKRGKDRLV